jgi:hypothetical protein
MKSWNLLSALALAGLLAAPAAWAGDPSMTGTGDRRPFPYGQAITPDASTRPPTPDSEAGERPTIAGVVTSVEHDSGHFVLDTDHGPVSLTTTPSQLTGVDVGDVVEVSLLDDGG